MNPPPEPPWLPWVAAALALVLATVAATAWLRPGHALQWVQLLSALCAPLR